MLVPFFIGGAARERRRASIAARFVPRYRRWQSLSSDPAARSCRGLGGSDDTEGDSKCGPWLGAFFVATACLMATTMTWWCTMVWLPLPGLSGAAVSAFAGLTAINVFFGYLVSFSSPSLPFVSLTALAQSDRLAEHGHQRNLITLRHIGELSTDYQRTVRRVLLRIQARHN